MAVPVRASWISWVLGLLAFTAARLYTALSVPPTRYPDSASYLDLSLLGHSERLWTVPALFAALPNDSARVVVQTAISIACWTALSFVLCSLFAPPFGQSGGIAVFVLGFSGTISSWDPLILSESVAISLTVLFVAAVLLYAHRPRVRWAAMVLVTALLWVFTRQLQALLFPLIVIPFVVLAVRSRRALHIVTASVLTAIAVWGVAATSRNDTVAQFNSTEIIFGRIEPHADRVAYFESRGMPRVDMTAALASPDPTRFLMGDRDLQAWIGRHWDSAYAMFALTHPRFSIVEPVKEAWSTAVTKLNYSGARTTQSVNTPLSDPETSPLVLAILGAMAVAGLTLSAWRRQMSSTLVVGLMSTAFAAVWYLAGWLLADAELPRISVPSLLLLHLGLGLIFLGALASPRVAGEATQPDEPASLAARVSDDATDPRMRATRARAAVGGRVRP